jgi:hypothetical protein
MTASTTSPRRTGPAGLYARAISRPSATGPAPAPRVKPDCVKV